ncbi:MAG: Trm112 family protein [Dinoroseobacter sp.]|nr:Trm112 family protein [Dinoroseobacter sp.]NQZ74216.1 Trm112 family protein [Dinoroseobacter sp.]
MTEDDAGDVTQTVYAPQMLEALVCPLTHAPLKYNAETQELISRAAHLAYPIRNGIPVMIEDEARKLD